jgi:hypothetical protein
MSSERTGSGVAVSGGRGAEAILDQALWRDLLRTGDDTACMIAWLGLICRAVPGAISGALLLIGIGQFKLAAVWPEGAGLPETLAGAARAAAVANSGVVQPPANGMATSLALLIQMADKAAAVVAIDVALPTGGDPRAAMRQMQWAAAWVRERLLLPDAARTAENGALLETAVDLLAATLERPGSTVGHAHGGDGTGGEADLRAGLDRLPAPRPLSRRQHLPRCRPWLTHDADPGDRSGNGRGDRSSRLTTATSCSSAYAG